MAQMNQQQTKYVRQRAETIYAAKRKEIEAECRDNGVSLDINEKLEAIRKGEITIKKPAPYQEAHQWYYQITFNAEKPPVVDSKLYNKMMADLTLKFTKLIDELILGDQNGALSMLKAFEAE